jgi:hypothetical protein
MTAAVSVGVVAVLLAACTPDEPKTTPKPSHSKSAPLFASDEEALKAATDAYAAYLKMSDTIAHDGGKDPERIKEFASGDALKTSLKSAEQYRDAEAHSTGWTKLGESKLQVARSREVVIYVCEDVSGVNVLDQTGKTLVSDSRPDRASFVATLSMTSVESGLVSRRETWDAGGACS